MRMETIRFHGRNRRVPVDDDGLVPIGYLEDIQAGRTPRSRNMDSRRRAVTTFPTRPEPMQALMWRTYPGRYDIEGIFPVHLEEMGGFRGRPRKGIL